MTKTFQRSLLAMALALSTGAVHAARIDSSELKVTGSLEVPACTVTAGDDGSYSYGTLNPSDIRPGTAVNTLAVLTKPWKISCEGDTYLTFKVIDNAEATRSVVAVENFGLGSVNGTGKIGYYTVNMRNPKVNGVASGLFSTNTTAIARASSVLLRQNDYVTGWSQAGANVQQIGKLFEADLDVTAVLAGTQTMNGAITDDVPLAGSLTLNFAYGL